MSIVIVFFSSYRFLGRQRIGSVKVQVKLKCNARGYYTTPNEIVKQLPSLDLV